MDNGEIKKHAEEIAGHIAEAWETENAENIFRNAKESLSEIAAGTFKEEERELLSFALDSPDLEILQERLIQLAAGTEKKRLFVDMDGTLAKFKPADTLETLYEEGYFYSLPPLLNVVSAVKRLMRETPEAAEVYILSSVLSGSKTALAEKNAWLDKYLPEINKIHRIFLPCGEDKRAGVPGGIRASDSLLDDYTQNLEAWEMSARGIKLLNGINGTGGKWKGAALSYKKGGAELAENLRAVMSGEMIKDKNPQEEMRGAVQKTALKRAGAPKL